MNSDCGYPLYWHNLYRQDYNLTVPDSYAHPAKESWDLGFRIIQHLEELGLLKEDSTVLDPMSGTGRFNIVACSKGYRSIGVELESKFVEFMKQNKEYAQRKLYKEFDWEIIQGDSRKLSALLVEGGLVSVTSPPYVERHSYPDAEREQALVDKLRANPKSRIGGRRIHAHENPDNPSNIGNLPDRPMKVITSPPYLEAQEGGGIAKEGYQGPKHTPTDLVGKRSYMPETAGESEGQIGVLPDKPMKTIVSPPYEDSNTKTEGMQGRGKYSELDLSEGINRLKDDYNKQASMGEGETYLSAMLQVYKEIALVSDVLVVVIKNPTRGGKLRRLDLDTIKVMELAGWRIHCRHRALLFEELEGPTLFGDTARRVSGRMSFFKRLVWRDGSPVARWEDVIIGVRRNER